MTYLKIIVLAILVLSLTDCSNDSVMGFSTDTSDSDLFSDSSYIVKDTSNLDTTTSNSSYHKLIIGEDAWNISVTTAVYVDGVYKGSVMPDSWGYVELPPAIYDVKLVMTWGGDHKETYYVTANLKYSDKKIDLETIL